MSTSESVTVSSTGTASPIFQLEGGPLYSFLVQGTLGGVAAVLTLDLVLPSGAVAKVAAGGQAQILTGDPTPATGVFGAPPLIATDLPAPLPRGQYQFVVSGATAAANWTVVASRIPSA